MKTKEEILNEEKNEHGHIKTPFDNRKALIIGDHPHAGKIATCLGADKLNAIGGFGLYFQAQVNDNDFYVINPRHVQWLQQK